MKRACRLRVTDTAHSEYMSSAQEQMSSRTSASPSACWHYYAGGFLFALVLLYPIARLATISSASGGQSLAYVQTLAKNPAFLRWVTNSALTSLALAAIGTAVASIGGYALSRSCDSTSDSNNLNSLAAIMLLLPLYLILTKLRLISGYLAVVIVYAATVLPFCIAHVKRRYDAIPRSLEEAAIIDGCSRWESYRLLVLPLVRATLLTTALLSFFTVWSLYVVAAVVLHDAQLFGAAGGLVSAASNAPPHPEFYSAAALLVSTPAIVLFLILSRAGSSRR